MAWAWSHRRSLAPVKKGDRTLGRVRSDDLVNQLPATNMSLCQPSLLCLSLFLYVSLSLSLCYYFLFTFLSVIFSLFDLSYYISLSLSR
jgi:hypothetical protein